MSNSNVSLVKNTSKHYNPVKDALKIVLIAAALSILAPTPVQAQSLSNGNNQSSTYSLMQDNSQSKTTYSREQITIGMGRVVNLINYFKRVYKDDGKTKKTEKEIKESEYIVNLFGTLDENSYGAFADNLDFFRANILDYRLIFVNGEFFDCSNNNRSYTKELIKGYKNVAVAMTNFKSTTTQDGKIKTEEQLKKDNSIADILEGLLISDEDINFLYEISNKNEEDITPEEKSEINKKYEELNEKLYYLIYPFRNNFEVSIHSKNGEEAISLNNALFFSNPFNEKNIEQTRINPLEYVNGKRETSEDSMIQKRVLVNVEGAVITAQATPDLKEYITPEIQQ